MSVEEIGPVKWRTTCPFCRQEIHGTATAQDSAQRAGRAARRAHMLDCLDRPSSRIQLGRDGVPTCEYVR